MVFREDAIFKTDISLRVTKLEGKVAGLSRGEKVVEDLSARLDNLKNCLQALKLKMTRKPEEGDNFRKMALETEIGKVLLQIDGIL